MTEDRYQGERVLVFPRAVLDETGAFQGIKTDVDRYLDAIFAAGVCRFMLRRVAEEDPAWKQLIPYVVIRSGEAYFKYARGDAGREARLHSLYSIGVGGHIQPEDGGAAAGPTAYTRGVRREIDEEVEIASVVGDRRVALINDDSNPVGKVHFGVVHIVDVDQPTVRPREAAVQDAGFATVEDLRVSLERYETWSQLTIAALLDGRIR